MADDQNSNTGAQGPAPASAPSISLPKGGGAIRGIGEKFAANPVTGTGSMTVPLATSPGRSGFGPQLSLSYDSGAGNGPFGLGWQLTQPSITRKTDKGLPCYRDAAESDVYLLSGAEDRLGVLQRYQTHGSEFYVPVGVDEETRRDRPYIGIGRREAAVAKGHDRVVYSLALAEALQVAGRLV